MRNIKKIKEKINSIIPDLSFITVSIFEKWNRIYRKNIKFNLWILN